MFGQQNRQSSLWFLLGTQDGIETASYWFPCPWTFQGCGIGCLGIEPVFIRMALCLSGSGHIEDKATGGGMP